MNDRTTSSDPFGGEACTALVLYAVENPSDEPDPSTPSLVVEPRWSHLLTADRAPYLSELSDEQFLDELDGAERKAASAEEKKAIDRIRDWYLRQRRLAVLFQLEPPSIAGRGIARKIGLAWEEAGSDTNS